MVNGQSLEFAGWVFLKLFSWKYFGNTLLSFQGIFCTICTVSKFSKVLVEWKETIENGERENDTSTSIDANYCFKTIPRGRQVKPGDRIAVYKLI